MKSKIIAKLSFVLAALTVAPATLLALTPPPPTVPDGGSTALFLTIGVLGLLAGRRLLSTRK